MLTTRPAPLPSKPVPVPPPGLVRPRRGVRLALTPARIPSEFEQFALDGFNPLSDPFHDTFPPRTFDDHEER